MLGKLFSRWGLVAMASVVVIAGALTVVLVTRGARDEDHPAWVDGDQETPNARHEAADEAKEAKFDRDGKEASRGPKSPAAEQVEDRAYPRSYVDDRLAVKEF